jgi:hypothetical protein
MMNTCDVCGNATNDAELKTIGDGWLKVCPVCFKGAETILLAD